METFASPDRDELLAAAENEIQAFTGGKTEYLSWIPQHAFPLAGIIIKAGEEVERLGRVLPLRVLRKLLDLYVGLHAYAFSLWQDRDAVELLLKPVLPRKM
jgi:hypothetical protein